MSASEDPARPDKGAPVGRRWLSRKILILVNLLFVLVACVAGFPWLVKQKYQRERKTWMVAALHRLASWSPTNEPITTELEELKRNPGDVRHHNWANDHVLLMANGEVLMCQFRHGFNGGFIDHLLLGRTTDGRWLYSTYHFCQNMAGIFADDQPRSIAEFEARYFAREFDGKSDECLRKTWPIRR